MLVNGMRICIIGNSGSGKSTLAKALGQKLNVPVCHLDRYLLRDNFEKLPDDEYRKVHSELINEDSWIIDGNYKKTLEERIRRSTLVVFLDISRLVTLSRVLNRHRTIGQLVDTVPEKAQPAKLSWEYLRWTASYKRKERIRYLRLICKKHKAPLLLVKNQPIDRMIEVISQEANKSLTNRANHL